ncbi:NSFL1 cofactor p47 [Echinococcus multilocularis]|uniref:NSFL1 cofactor p47 n=1 Tax=Echinococcus multilocularis TaxID=6211 RepID=A0A087VYP4_ECHMU|nr:NSFL1 cofactor p47 [Echinococcus multilocularis]
MSQDDRNKLVEQVVDICQTDAATARSYLQLFNWNLNDAIENLLNAADDGSTSEEFPIHQEVVSGSNSFCEREQTRPTASGSFHQSESNSGPRIATLSSLDDRKGRQHGSDDEQGQAFYVGGAEHGGGGQQVLGPPRPDNPESFVQGIFRAAREGGAETLDHSRVSDLGFDSASHREVFAGTGYRLGESLSDPLVKVPGKQSSSRSVGVSSHGYDGEEGEGSGEAQSVVVKMWHNGFSLDDGPLRSYTDPDSLEFMAAIKQGRIPPELISSSRNREVHVLLEDHHDEPYRQPPAPKVKAFSGVGRILGNPTPKVITNAPPAVTDITYSSSLLRCPEVDQSKPTTQLQIRLPDSSRLVVKLNHQHTVQDLRAAIISQRPELASQSFGLHTAFPRNELTDNSATLVSANLLNSTLLVTRS